MSTKLTDEQVKMISDTLTQEGEAQKGIEESYRKIMNASDEEKEKMLEMPEEDGSGVPYNVLNKSLVKTNALVSVNPATGEKVVMKDQSKLKTKTQEEIEIEDLLGITDEDISNADIKLAEIQDEVLTKSTKELADLSDDDAMIMLNLIKKSEDGIEVTYDELPTKIALLVDNLRVGPDGKRRSTKTVIKDLLHFIKNQAQADQEIINLQDTLQKEMDMPSLIGMYNEQTDKLMSESLINLANKAEEEGKEDKAKQLRLMSSVYEDAKNFISINNAIENKEKEAKKLDREVKRFNKYIRDFNFKYAKNTKFTIDSLQNTSLILQRHTQCTEEQAKKFLIIFCRICLNKSSNDVIDHIYMYFTLKTITTLDAYKPNDEVYVKKIEQLRNILQKLK